MKRVLCWDPEDAFAIINPDADAVENHVFRAVHTNFPIRIRASAAGIARTVDPADLVKEILFPKDHLIVPVVGQTGTGKSHLIRWLDLQLRAGTDSREVIYVPKAQTNLRDILFSLVRRLPNEMQESYLTALSMTGSASLTPVAQRTAVLNQLHLAIVNDQGDDQRGGDPDLENYARVGLRAMFSDPHIRKMLLIDGGFAAEIAAHVFDKPEKYRPAEERREFREKDLPLQVSHLKEAARETQEFLGWLLGASAAEKNLVVDIVNRHLDWAIGNCLNLGGDRLITLMLDLRRHFRAQGRELVLLIEDFARLQGLDRALLQSIIEQRPDLCVLRTIFACTSGFYNSIRDTVRTRVTFLVDMDAGVEDEPTSVEGFVSRYMNAMRWGTTALLEQWQGLERAGDDIAIPSRCDDCSYRVECHQTFGAIEGMGLYPFTAKSIGTMAQRTDSNYPSSFNPREFQRLVLRPVALAGNDLKIGQFPPAKLLAGLGGKTSSPAVQSRLQREDSVQWQRRLTFLELWGAVQDVRNLDQGLHTAFDLPPLRNVSTAEPSQDEGRVGTHAAPGVAAADARLRELQDWHDERLKLSSKTCQALRELVYPALHEYIDWDDIGLAATPVMGGKGAFKQGSISFYNQATQPSIDPLRLSIPADWSDADSRLRTTLALQGLLQAKAEGSWSFADGVEKLACLTECLQEWARSLIAQFQGTDSGESRAVLAESALALRLAQQFMLNSALADDDQTAMKAVFAPACPANTDFIVPELAGLLGESTAQDATLREVINSRYAATKGGQAGAFIDASRVLPIIKTLRRRRFTPTDASTSSERPRRDSVDPISRLAKRWNEVLPGSLLREAAAREELKLKLSAAFGDRLSHVAILDFAQRLSNAAGYISLSGNQALIAAKAKFELVDFDSFRAALRLADPQKPDIRDVRSGVGLSAKVTSEFLQVATQMLDRIYAELAGRLEAVGLDPEEKSRLADAIATDLEGIAQELTEYKDAVAS